jgi:hypothetical protein
VFLVSICRLDFFPEGNRKECNLAVKKNYVKCTTSILVKEVKEKEKYREKINTDV